MPADLTKPRSDSKTKAAENNLCGKEKRRGVSGGRGKGGGRDAEWDPLGAAPSQLEGSELLGDPELRARSSLRVTGADTCIRNAFWLPEQVTLSTSSTAVKKGGFAIRQT